MNTKDSSTVVLNYEDTGYSPGSNGGNAGTGNSGSAAGADPCTYIQLKVDSLPSEFAARAGLPESAAGGAYYLRNCPSGGPGSGFVFLPSGADPANTLPSPVSLAQQARSTMTVLTPQIVLDPFYLLEDGRRATLKNIETWLWTDAANWTTQTDRLEVGPVWVEVTAIPRTIVVTPNDGVTEPMLCAGPGTPIPPNTPVSEPSPDCSLKFRAQTNGDTWPVTVSVIYDASWVGSNGTTSVGGDLPDLVSAPVTIPLAVLTAKPQLVDPNGD